MQVWNERGWDRVLDFERCLGNGVGRARLHAIEKRVTINLWCLSYVKKSRLRYIVQVISPSFTSNIV